MKIVGNKIDKREEREVVQKTIEEYIEKNLVETFEISDKRRKSSSIFGQTW